GLLTDLLAAVAKQIRQTGERLFLPAANLRRMDAEHLSDLGGRLLAFDGLDGDLGLQAGWVTLARSGHWLSFIFNAAHHLRKADFLSKFSRPLHLAVDDAHALQAAADRLTPGVIRERLEYWTLILGPKFSKRERAAMNLRRFYAVNQIEYCRNFIFKRHFPIHRIFERSCEIGLWRLTANKISEIFGSRVTTKLKGKLNTTLEQI